MDGNFARNLDLGGLFRWLLPLAAIGALTLIAGAGWLIWYAFHHISFVGG